MSTPSIGQIAELGVILFRLAENAIGRSDNATVQKILALGRAAMAGIQTAGAIDTAMAARIRELGASMDAGGELTRGDWETLASDVRTAVSRWNAAG